MTTYKISIVTVCLGQLSKAQWSLRSILGQERSDIQWVVVTPEKGAELAEWLDKKPYGDMKVTTVSGRNRYEAMRKGVEHADGEYVLFLEAGNRFYSSTSLKEAIEKPDNLRPDILVGSTEYLTRYGIKVVHVLPFDVVSRELPFRLESAFIRRELLLQHPFDTRYRWAGDYAFLHGLPPVTIKQLRYPVVVVNRQHWWSNPHSVELEREYRLIQGRMQSTRDRLGWLGYLGGRMVSNFLRMILPDCLFANRENNRDLYR